MAGPDDNVLLWVSLIMSYKHTLWGEGIRWPFKQKPAWCLDSSLSAYTACFLLLKGSMSHARYTRLCIFVYWPWIKLVSEHQPCYNFQLCEVYNMQFFLSMLSHKGMIQFCGNSEAVVVWSLAVALLSVCLSLWVSINLRSLILFANSECLWLKYAVLIFATMPLDT